ncbi:MAG: protein kinase [Solirubrobacteraceae bacterium]
MPDLAPGTVFAGHRIVALAGRGGMGVVYRATHLALGRTVALKVIAPNLIEDRSTRQRFLREARTAASIDHPNVIPVYYTGEEDGIAYIVMRYVAGDDLRSLVRSEGELEAPRATRIVFQVGAGLDAAHGAGLVHRDVKPANILLGPQEHVYLSDFGLSKHALSDRGETASGRWVGTLDYVAPEQIRGERLDARADVYALGCVLYFALTGSAPFAHDGEEAKLWAHISEPPPAPSERVAGLAPELDDVVARGMAKRPGDRYPSAGDLGRAAVAAAAREPVRERERMVGVGAAAPDETPTESLSGPADPPPRAQVERAPQRRRPPRAALAAGFAALVAAVIATGALNGETPAPRRPADPRATRGAGPMVPHVVARVTVGKRPNSIAIGRGTVFVTNFGDRRVTLIDEKTAKLRRPGPTVGVGGLDSASGLGAVWVVVGRENALFRLDPASGRRLAKIAMPMEPHTVTTGHGAVWVGMVSTAAGVSDRLAMVEPRTGRILRTIPFAEGIRTVVSSPSGLWIVHRLAAAVSRFDLHRGAVAQRISVGHNSPTDATYSAGVLWVSSQLEDSVTRIDEKSGAKITSGVGRRPQGITARGGQVWVANLVDHTLTRIDPVTSRPTGAPVAVPLNPYAVALTADSVWLTAVGRGEVARVRYVLPG